jgi:peptidoglycan/LPS O-acetylase OafA/YrhL
VRKRLRGVKTAVNKSPAHKYRPDIDGLRAVAVLSVVGYHAFPHWVRGGFAGVDIFFVISGYLISGIILSGLSTNGFRFGTFYSRRIKRIFPALILVLGACFAAGWFVLLPREYEQLGKHIAGGAGFVSNLVLWRESGYFDIAAELKPLLHLWSLGIEEQFYLVWPALVYTAWKIRLKPLYLIVTVLLVSFALNVCKVHADAVATFYSPLARFWELTVGSALAYITLFKKDHIETVLGRIIHTTLRFGSRPAFRHAGGFVGALLIVVAVFFLSPDRAFPGWWAVLPVGGTFLVIAAGPGAWLSDTVLSSRAMVAVGLISYPLYLWHWPLLSFARILQSGKDDAVIRTGAVLVSFALAWVTYRLVERPIRYGGRGLPKVLCLAFLMVIAGLAGFLTFESRGFESRRLGSESSLIRKYASLKYEFKKDARYETCWLNSTEAADRYSDQCLDRGGSEPVVFVWGDSHAARLFPGLRIAVGERLRLGQYTRDSCPPILDLGGIAYENCISANLFILEQIRKTKPEAVILFAVWNHYGAWGPGQPVTLLLDYTIREIKKLGVSQVMIIGPAPQWKESLPRILMNLHRAPRRSLFGLETQALQVDDALEHLAGARKDVTYVSAWKTFCNHEGCLTRVDDEADGIVTWDYGHLTTRGAEYLAKRLPIMSLKSSP